MNALVAHQGEPLADVPNKLHDKVPNKLPDKLQALMEMIEEELKISAASVALSLGVSERRTIRNTLCPLRHP